MSAFVTSAARAVGSLLAPGMMGVMVACVLTTIAALIGFIVLMSWLSAALAPSELWAWAGGIGSMVLAWFLFPGIMPVVVNFFGERIASLIEAQDYPAAQVARPSAFWAEFRHDARFSLMAILLNILVLPLYLVPVVNIFLFYLLNGWLLGREFFTMAARRHVSIPEAEGLRKHYGNLVLMAGVALTVLATIPIVNLFAPFWGVAIMTHLFHRLRAPITLLNR